MSDNKSFYKIENDTIIFDEYIGEFGWEACSAIPMYRKLSRQYKKAICSSFRCMEPFYRDFCEFIPHDLEHRALKFEPKKYKVNGEFKKYGTPNDKYDVLIHARGISRKSNINYTRWNEVTNGLQGLSITCIGTLQDQKIDNINDERHINLELLCNYMAGAKVCIGCSSGIMHLASHCGCNQVVWADSRTHNGETLEKRYKKSWNPFNTEVEFITNENWSPDPEEIIKRIRKFV